MVLVRRRFKALENEADDRRWRGDALRLDWLALSMNAECLNAADRDRQVAREKIRRLWVRNDDVILGNTAARLVRSPEILRGSHAAVNIDIFTILFYGNK